MAIVFNNFSTLPHKRGEMIRSSPFIIGVYEFSIRLYPRGDRISKTDQNVEHVAIYLEMHKPSTSATMKCSLSILDANGAKRIDKIQATFEFDSLSNAKGYTKFVQRTDLLSNVLAYTDDQLIILCEIIDLDQPGSSYLLRRLCDYEEYLDNEEYSDVKIIVQGRTIHVHKIVLMSGNQVFASMFKHNTKESEENIIIIEDIEYEVVIELIRFIYTGQVRNIQMIVKDLLIAADKYDTRELKSVCSNYLCRILSANNVLPLLSFADLYKVDKLKEEAISFFVSHQKDVAKIDDYENRLKKVGADLLAQLITHMPDS